MLDDRHYKYTNSSLLSGSKYKCITMYVICNSMTYDLWRLTLLHVKNAEEMTKTK